MESEIKKKQSTLTTTQNEAKDDKSKKAEVDALKTEVANLKSQYKTVLRERKNLIGTNFYNRFNKGFNKTHNQEENENIAHSEFLFKKLRF